MITQGAMMAAGGGGSTELEVIGVSESDVSVEINSRSLDEPVGIAPGDTMVVIGAGVEAVFGGSSEWDTITGFNERYDTDFTTSDYPVGLWADKVRAGSSLDIPSSDVSLTGSYNKDAVLIAIALRNLGSYSNKTMATFADTSISVLAGQHIIYAAIALDDYVNSSSDVEVTGTPTGFTLIGRYWDVTGLSGYNKTTGMSVFYKTATATGTEVIAHPGSNAPYEAAMAVVYNAV